MQTRTRIAIGSTVGVALTCTIGVGAFAATITPTAGPDTGNTQTSVSIADTLEKVSSNTSGQILDNSNNSQVWFIGADGTLRASNGGAPAAGPAAGTPAGVTFTSADSAYNEKTGTRMVAATASDGTIWMLDKGNGSFVQVQGSAGSTSFVPSLDNNNNTQVWFIAADGTLRVSNGGSPATGPAGGTPAGVTFTSVAAVFNEVTNTRAIAATASDGTIWMTNQGNGTFVQVPGSAGSTSVVPVLGNDNTDEVWFVAADGTIRRSAGGAASPGPAAGTPAGVTFASVEVVYNQKTNTRLVTATGTDGSIWMTDKGNGTFVQVQGSAGSTSFAPILDDSNNTQVWFIAADGTLRTSNGGSPATGPAGGTPAGVTFTSVETAYNETTGTRLVTAIATDGTVWTLDKGNGTFVASSKAQTLSITEVDYDGTAGTSLSTTAPGEASVNTPAHAAGPVDVVVKTAFSSGAAGPTDTIADGFTYVATPATPAVNPFVAGGAAAVALAIAGAVALDRRRRKLAAE